MASVCTKARWRGTVSKSVGLECKVKFEEQWDIKLEKQ